MDADLIAAAERLADRDLGQYQGPTGDDADIRAGIALARHFRTYEAREAALRKLVASDHARRCAEAIHMSKPVMAGANYHEHIESTAGLIRQAIDAATADLRAELDKLRERLRDQTIQTQATYQQVHDAVLSKLDVPDGIDPQGHPIEQVVATCIGSLRQQLADARAENKRLRAALPRPERIQD